MAEISTVLQSASESARQAAHERAAQTATAAAEAERQAQEVQARAPYAAVVAGSPTRPASPAKEGRLHSEERGGRSRAKDPPRDRSRRANSTSKSRSPAPRDMAGKGKGATLALQDGTGLPTSSQQTPLERARAAKAAIAIEDSSMDANDLRDV